MTYPKNIDISILEGEPTYGGSVQDLFSLEVDGNEYFLCRTSDSGSVFDVGTIFSVPDSDVLRTLVRHLIYTGLEDPETWKNITEEDIKYCYQREDILKDLLDGGLLSELKEKGVYTHHAGMVDKNSGNVTSKNVPENPSSLVLIEKFPVYRPKRSAMWGRFGWDYHEYYPLTKKVVALEHIFRLGAPGGSSLLRRYNAAVTKGPEAEQSFINAVGLDRAPVTWGMFPDMIYDCTTKYEPSDRQLDWQETIHISGVDGPTFEKMAKTLALCTVYVCKFFRELGFTLWDIKWECAVDDGKIVVVDTIDPDSIRITGTTQYDGQEFYIHYNKQSIRDYYRLCQTAWYDHINEAKKLAKTDSLGRPFMEIYKEGVKEGKFLEIPEYDSEFGRIQSRKYAVIVEPLIGKTSKEDARAESDELMKQEIEYYKNKGKLDDFLKIVAK